MPDIDKNDLVGQLTAATNSYSGAQGIDPNYTPQSYYQSHCWPQYQYAYTQCYGEHAYTDEEKLLLLALRKDATLKDKTLKFVLAELLKSIG